MKRTISVKLDSNLYKQLELTANKMGVSKRLLVREKLEGLLLESDELDNLTLFNDLGFEKDKSFPLNTELAQS